MKAKKVIPEGQYLISVDYVSSVKNPNAYWDSFIKNEIVKIEYEQNLEEFLTELLQEDGVLNKKVKVRSLIYDNNDNPVGVCCSVYTEDYTTGKKLYFEAWITIKKVCYAEFLNSLDK